MVMRSLESFDCFCHDDHLPVVKALFDRVGLGKAIQKGGLVGVSGGPGSGKSHFVSALCKYFELQPVFFDPTNAIHLPKFRQVGGLVDELERITADLPENGAAMIFDDYDFYTDEKHRVVIEDYIFGHGGLIFRKPVMVFMISCRFNDKFIPYFDVYLQISLSFKARQHILETVFEYADELVSVNEMAGMLNGYNYYNIRDFIKHSNTFTSKGDIERYLKENKPSVVTEMINEEGLFVSMDYSMYTLDQLGGMQATIDNLRENLVRPFERQTLYEQHKIAMPTGILLYGPSGCGKTHLAIAMARSQQHKFAFLHVNAAGLRSKYVGDTEKRIASIFKRARSMAPSIIFLDHIDHLLVSRQGGNNDQDQSIVTAFLVELDGVFSRPGEVVVLAVATDKDAIDKAILRPGRLGHHIKMDIPTSVTEIEEVISVILNLFEHTLTKDDIHDLAESCMGSSQAEIRGLVLRAARRAIYDNRGRAIHVDDFIR